MLYKAILARLSVYEIGRSYVLQAIDGDVNQSRHFKLQAYSISFIVYKNSLQLEIPCKE